MLPKCQMHRMLRMQRLILADVTGTGLSQQCDGRATKQKFGGIESLTLVID